MMPDRTIRLGCFAVSAVVLVPAVASLLAFAADGVGGIEQVRREPTL